jgi:hypothetical protein
MPLGKCLLCHQSKDLQDSHFIGKAVYRRLGEDSLKNPFPILLGNRTMRQSSNQMRDYVFCFDCEQIFNVQGERWVHAHLATVKGFPLFDLLKAYTPVFGEGDYAVYDAKAISGWDCEKLLHYGAGIFFKAGVHVWEAEGDKISINLGPELDELRRFVLGQAAFPADMALSISIAGNANPLLAAVSPVQVGADGFDQFQFYVPGIMYTFQVGKGIPADTHAMAFSSPTIKMVFVRDVSEQAKHFLRILQPDKTQADRIIKSFASAKKMTPSKLS